MGERVRCACGKSIVVPEPQPRVAKVLHCSACGGDVGSATEKCRYCGSEITQAERDRGPPCPVCFARLAANARFCAECGVAIEPMQIRTTRVDVPCPRCKGALVARETEGLLITDCTRCGGLWLDAQAFESLVQKRDTKRLSSAAVTSSPPPEALPDTVQYLPCLVCTRLMQRKNFAGCSGVIVDWCRDHGIWFDAHELETIVKFIEQGGMEKARRHEASAPRTTPRRVSPAASMPSSGPGYSYTSYSDDWLRFALQAVVDLFF